MYEQENIIAFIDLFTRTHIDIEKLPTRLNNNTISEEDKHFLGVAIGLLNKIFGKQGTRLKKAATDTIINHQTQSIFESYETVLSADALAARLQLIVDRLLIHCTKDTKNKLLNNIDAASQVLEDSSIVARLGMMWSYIHAAQPALVTAVTTESEPMTRARKKELLQLLVQYRSHLSSEIWKAWPYYCGIAGNREGEIFILNAQRIPINEKRLPKNLLLLKQKKESINKCILYLESNKATLSGFRHHFVTKTKPIISQRRTEIDNAFLNAITKAVMRPLCAISSFFAPKGERVVEDVEKIIRSSVLKSHLNSEKLVETKLTHNSPSGV